ncbi:hypothetical protein GOODEAATRI_002098 [Goodea atripinnis]|uniref:Uncharacterized protein n=1 Tax=Goodea atripinnis TaxID=208336 RepID=A0ABV0PK66_9TELE
MWERKREKVGLNGPQGTSALQQDFHVLDEVESKVTLRRWLSGQREKRKVFGERASVRFMNLIPDAENKRLKVHREAAFITKGNSTFVTKVLKLQQEGSVL